jgi:hypothetical protein
MRLRFVAIFLVVCLTIAFVGWRVVVTSHLSPPQVALVRDTSGSDAVGCKAVRALSVRAAKLPDIGQGSKLTLFTTGDGRTAYEARLVHAFDLPFSKRVMEDQRLVLRRQQELGDLVEAACAGLRKTGVSPILSAVKGAVVHLKASGCGQNLRCAVFVETDGEETVNEQLRSALRGSTAALQRMRGTINNEGVTVAFCGFAQSRVVARESTAASTRTPVERLQLVWKSIFTDQMSVSMAPYCTEE